MKTRFFYLLTFIILTCPLFSQQGKDGAGNITVANTIVNVYTSLTAGASVGNTTLTVANTASFNVGDLVFIIQMQGASVNAGKDTIFPDLNSSIPTNTTYGAITNYNTCGNYEYTQVKSVPNATSLILDCGLQNNYNFLNKVQVIRVPRYTTLSVSGAGFITAPNWNGTVGGVSVVEVMTTTTLSALPSFSLTGKGFRGGAAITTTLTYVGGGNKFGSVLIQEGGEKGESIAGDQARYGATYSGRYGRGAFANGGAGGCTHNAGGSGGANAGNLLNYKGTGNPVAGFATAWNLEGGSFSTSTSSGGGRGGYSHSGANQNVNTVPPGSGSWSGDGRRIVGGYGGRPLDYSLGKLFIGGGGGCGHGNNALVGDAGNGGGMVFMLCYGNLGGAGTIVADGATSTNLSICADGDGGSGGGGGGTIILNSAGTINLTAPTALSAVGGKGGNASTSCAAINANAYGPGGGGGGGYIAATGALPTNNVSGGANGIFLQYINNIASNFPPNGATIGGAGSTGSAVIYTLSASANPTICTSSSTTLSTSSTNTAAGIIWYDQAAGGTQLGVGSVFTTSVFAAPGTYSVYAGSCPGSYRIPVQITVITGPTLTINSPTICPGAAVTLTASGATTYTWNTGPTTSTISVNPITTTVYTVTGTFASCSASKTTTVNVIPSPTVTVNSPSICANTTVALVANGATTYSWSTTQTTQTIVVAPVTTTTFTVIGTTGTCTSSATSTVTVVPNPTITVASTTICPGAVGTLTASGASTYTWNPGAVTGTTFTDSPGSTSVYTVIGSASTCTGQTTGTITISPSLSITVVSTTMCPGGTGTLSASGATSYTWNPGAVTGTTFTDSPASTSVYTVMGSSGTCTGQATGTIAVNPAIPLTVTSPTICSGQTGTITAGGATSYTWNTGPTTSSIAVTPTISTNYTITGSLSGCSSSMTTMVTVLTLPTVTASSASICAGQNATLTAGGASTYTWNPGGPGGSIVVSPASTQNYSLTGTDAAGCTNTAVTSVSVAPNPTVTASSATVCAGQTATLIASGAITYTWNPGAVVGSTYTIAAGNSTVSVIGANGSCTAAATASVTLGTALSITINSPTICAGQTVTLTATSPATSYTWTPGGATTSSIVVTPSVTTTYTVDGSSGACNGSGTTTVTVNSNPTVAVNSSTICSGQSTTLTASGATTYTWMPGSTNGNTLVVNPTSTTAYSITGTILGCNNSAISNVTVIITPTLTVNSPTICGGSATLTANGATNYTWMPGGAITSSIVVSPTVTSTYSLTGANGTCVSNTTTSVGVATAPPFTFTSNVGVACVNACITFSTATSGFNPITYNFGDGSMPTSSLSSNCYTASGSFSVTANATYSTGCTVASTNTVIVLISSAPVASFTVASNSPYLVNTPIGFNNTSVATGTPAYSWYFGDASTMGSNAASPTHTYLNSGNYCVKLVALEVSSGCKDSIIHCIDVEASISINIPNIFTPNNDGVNDLFIISSVGIKDLECAVYDRWGLKMYEWTGIGGYWDGKTKSGASVPNGTYFYIITYRAVDGNTTTTKGSLSLFKE